MRKNLAIIYFSVDALLIAVCAYFGAIHVLNSQVALICSTLIIFASFLGYKNKVKKRALNADISVLDDEEDEFNLDENSSKNSTENSRIPKAKSPRIPLRFYDFASLFAPFRLISYLLLILAFFYLVRHDLFRVFSFLAGLGVMPFCALFAGVLGDKR